MTLTTYGIKPQLFSLEYKVPCDMALPTFEPHPMPIPLTQRVSFSPCPTAHIVHSTWDTLSLQLTRPDYQSLLKTHSDSLPLEIVTGCHSLSTLRLGNA